MRTPAVVLSVAGLIVMLAGCSAGQDTPSASPSVTTSPAAQADSGTTLADLQSMYIEAGGQCDSITTRTTAVASEAGDCADGALLTTYTSVSQRDSAILVLKGLQDTNPAPHVVAAGPDWIVNGPEAGLVASAMGGEPLQIGEPAVNAAQPDLSTDEALCAADAEMTNLELNDALAPLLGFSPGRSARTPDQDDAIRAHKNAAFERACPERVG